MNRRELIKNTAAGLVAFSTLNNSKIQALANNIEDSTNKQNAEIIKPKALKFGDKVGVIAPATSVTDPEDIYRAKETLNYFGLEGIFGKSLKNGSGYKTRTVKERLDDFHAMFEDKSIKGVFCVRGGYGTPGLLDKINYELIKANPKVFCGYSDITALHLAINKKSNLLTFHGPVLLSNFSKYTEDSFRKAIFSNEKIGEYSNPIGKRNFRNSFPTMTIVKGSAEGALIGGNLSLVAALMGTPYEIDTVGKIVFLEDVGEQPFRIERMLTQLKLAGKFDNAAAVIFGKCEDCTPSGNVWDRSLGEVIQEVLGDLKIPVLSGLMIGHTAEQLTLPQGIKAELDADEATLDILESACI